MKSFKYLQIVFFGFIFLAFVGCGVKNLSHDELSLGLNAENLNDNFKNFPIKKDYIFANIEVEKPKLFIAKNSDKISANMKTSITTIMLPRKDGSFVVSGIPYFDEKTSSVYLKDIEIDKFEFPNVPITKQLANLMLSNIQPVMNNVFKNFPVYTLKKSSLRKKSVKKVYVKNQELVVDFGMK